MKKWKAPPCKKVGRPFKFSDHAIETLLILRFIYHLPLRQLQGFAMSLMTMLKMKAEVPHFTCIGKRMQKMHSLSYLKKKKVTDVVFDTTGIRVYESGEWKKEKYGNKRKWKKIHVGIDLKTKEIVYSKATDSQVHDLSLMDELFESMNRRKGRFLIDGIGDTHQLYNKCRRHNKTLLTPPRKGASWRKGCSERRLAVKLQLLLGGDKTARSIWSKLTGYNQRSHIEGLFSRWERVLGEALRSKLDQTISTEVYIKSLILNKMIFS
ncbi:MAG: hypothetical protein COT84_07005 [Chlamydiae bacterium CG10_big_fil_rev_8_21_14_0_10_35_9]|nr:MAG: hypothetical protein COT84_07005 [Chlamydiae bacterium CG10_big_fil_rev_8_21_14_0_10_35_9]